MIRRATLDDVEQVNRWIGRDFPGVDFTEILSNEMNVCLAAGEGGAFFMWRGPRIYEVHVFFEQRGREVIRISHEMLRIMRADYGARMFWAAVPVESRKVLMFTRLMGWKSNGCADFPHGLCEIFSGD
jgi:hypothetical protein